jgi:carbon-monoxide dehydrogenase large subunit
MRFENESAALPPNEMVGASVQRREDPRLLTGTAAYADDIQHRRDYHVAIHRSQYAHARIDALDVSTAESMDGVLDVYTADALGDADLPTEHADDGVSVAQPTLARERVHYQGQPVAAVVAEDRYIAAQGADAIEVTYDRLDAIVDPVDALECDDAPGLHDEAPDNLAFEWSAGDRTAARSAIAAADTVVEVDLEINRVLPTTVEPRAAVARYGASSGELQLDLSTQKPHAMQGDLSRILDIPRRKIHVRSADVGGGFGAKCRMYPGYVLAARAAMDADDPVKWTSTRTEEHTSTSHSRHHVVQAEVGVLDDGRIQGFHAETIAPVGAYLFYSGILTPTNLGVMAQGQYDIPHTSVRTRGVYTNTTPLSAYRGAGRPEATYWAERMVRTVADELGMDPVALRRRNMIQPAEFPYDTGLGRVYDSGDYEGTLDAALGKVDYAAFRDRQATAREEGRYLGIGLSSYVEACGSAPGRSEIGEIELASDGSAVVSCGTAEIGTSLETVYSQIVGSELGIPAADVEIRLGDTDQTITGSGTSGSRGVAVGGSAITESARKVLEKARMIAAHTLETRPDDIEFEGGRFHVTGAPDRSVTIQEVAELAYSPAALPEDVEPGLSATTHFDPDNYTFTFGCHVVIVEVDVDSGEIEIERYVAVDDVGTQMNPTLLEGQIVGGIGQGLGQALYEDVVYDDNGQLLSGSLQDYPVPRAHHMPEIEWDSTVTPTPHNPLGAKGAGEAGTIAAPPATVNAVIDALAPFDIRDLDMPLTPEKVWQVVEDATSGG